MATYTDLTDFFEYKLRIASDNLIELAENDRAIQEFVPLSNRPLLRYHSATQVKATQNNNEFFQDLWQCLFPDGHQILNNPNDATHHFDITRTADWTSWPSGYQGGLRSGLSEAANTWYAIYAVLHSDPYPYLVVMVGDDTLPIQSNYATLNSRYGQNHWVYMGMIRNGDNWSNHNDILPFKTLGNRTYLIHTNAGIQLAGASAASVTWAYSAGLGGAQVPGHIKFIKPIFRTNPDTGNVTVQDFAGTGHYILHSGHVRMIDTIWLDIQRGLRIDGSKVDFKFINLNGWKDPILGLGYYAQL